MTTTFDLSPAQCPCCPCWSGSQAPKLWALPFSWKISLELESSWASTSTASSFISPSYKSDLPFTSENLPQLLYTQASKQTPGVQVCLLGLSPSQAHSAASLCPPCSRLMVLFVSAFQMHLSLSLSLHLPPLTLWYPLSRMASSPLSRAPPSTFVWLMPHPPPPLLLLAGK